MIPELDVDSRLNGNSFNVGLSELILIRFEFSSSTVDFTLSPILEGVAKRPPSKIGINTNSMSPL